ncbi:ionotropic receptor 93a [Caerostris extrusa]|uniref:Ionotropic receptor 93a n=1 Tax=Caerostris extrusa TaxID=172846 RepID=A0AAV4RNE1_CAEEX|nr:ionotropic receptor 93a [Caerostris extrusa]
MSFTAPIVEPFVAQAGTEDARANILELEGTLQDTLGENDQLLFTKNIKYTNLGDLLMSYSEKERGCPRPPPKIGFGVPYLNNMLDIVPFMVDIRSDNRVLDKWDDIIILHDNTIDLNSLEALVSMLHTMGIRKRSTTLTIYNVCQAGSCEDMSVTIQESLTPYSVIDFPKNFLILSTGKAFRKIIEQAKKLRMLDGERQWLFVATKHLLDSEATIAANSLPPEANVALVYPDNPVNQKKIAWTTSGTKATCGGCLNLVMKTTAYLQQGKKVAQTIDDYETVGTWKLFGGFTVGWSLCIQGRQEISEGGNLTLA